MAGEVDTLSVRHVRRAFQQVADSLRELMMKGDLRPGARLPTEPQLAINFRVSRSTVREALRTLAAEGLIDTKRGPQGGSTVAAPGSDTLISVLEANIGLFMATGEIRLDHVFEVAASVEVPLAQWAAERRTDHDLQRLRAVLDPPDGVTSGPFEFHYALLAAARNPLAGLFMRSLWGFMRERYVRPVTLSAAWYQQVRTDHDAILRALEHSDGQAAQTALEQHLGRLYGQFRTAADPDTPTFPWGG
jgi:GntR family transcriptional repressor for pyruvate dehydrogenase complex